ncbi:cleavage and polyadenylation specificity factor subunit 7-like [Hypanus sabinus]|uniref:cleavage and polyadenylation specificity factor subunit 7-like n=1 Tax=Hypanus sabinus TaxID=79690 RepID=UPI0028C4B90B|nr:cleavage and polyadenylation specificity factor subunit 7-like [Hypanus sabinus]XP_059806010.1 cleavage and polyadenylation specificity factor subunit 7-like [Hypanus sabinus]
MAVHSNMAVHGLLQAGAAGAGSSEQVPGGGPENENQNQMDLYDDLIDDIIGVPLDNGFNPKKDNCNLLPECSSSEAIASMTEAPASTTPSKPSVLGKVAVPLLERSLLIGNLTWWTSADDLVSASRSAGVFNVNNIRIYEVPKGGQSKGFAKVDLSSDWDSYRLLEMIPKRKIHGRIPDVRPFTTANRQYFETQFIRAVKKSKAYSSGNEVFSCDGSDRQSAFDSLKETVQGDSSLQDQTPSPIEQSAVKLTASVVGNKFQPAAFLSPNFLLRNFISLGVSAMSIPRLGFGGHGYRQSFQVACATPAPFVPPINPGFFPFRNNLFPPMFNPYRALTREPHFQETLQSMEIRKELERRGAILPSNESKDDSSEDYGSLLRLVSFVKKTKSVTPDNYRDSLNCPPSQLHGTELKQFSSGLRELEYPRQRENQRSGERSGSVRDRSRSPSSSDGHYQDKKMDYDQERQQRIHCDYSPRRDHHSDRSRDKRDSYGLEGPCDSLRYTSRSDDLWHVYSEKSGKGHDYSEEKYLRKKEKDREYEF